MAAKNISKVKDGQSDAERRTRGTPRMINDTNGMESPFTGNEPPKTMAVALEYDENIDGVPRVVASGRGWIAEQILSLAFAHGVKVRQDADLVQLLSAIDIDSDIPPEAFVAVSEILAYVYKANGNLGDWFGEDGQ